MCPALPYACAPRCPIRVPHAALRTCPALPYARAPRCLTRAPRAALRTPPVLPFARTLRCPSRAPCTALCARPALPCTAAHAIAQPLPPPVPRTAATALAPPPLLLPPLHRYCLDTARVRCRLALPFLFPELFDFTTVANLTSHLRSLDTRYRTALRPDFLGGNQPPIDRTIAASRGSPSLSFFKGCSPSLLVPSVFSAAAVDFLSAEEVGTASASSGRRRSRGRRTRGWGGGGGGGGSSGHGGGHGGSGGGGGGNESTKGGGQGLGGSRGGADWGGGPGMVTQVAVSGGVEAASVGACEFASTGADPMEALHIFTLDSGARDCTSVTWLTALVPVTLADPSSGPQNGIAELRIGLVMEVARTSMIHAAAPHFLWPFAVRYAAHQLNLWPRVSLPETSPTLRWTGKVGDASVFRVWGSHAFVRDTSADKLSACAIPCVFLGFFPDAPSCAAPSAASAGAELGGAGSGGAEPGGAGSGGAEPGGAGSEGAGSGGAEPGGAESEGAESEGVESEGAESGGAEPRGAASSGGPAGASPRVSSQQLREWLVQRAHRRSGVPGAGEPGDARAGGAAVTTGAGEPGGAGAGIAGVGGPGAGGTGGAGAGAVDPGAGGNVRPRPYFVPLLQQVLGVVSSPGLPPPFLCPSPDQSQPPLQPSSPLPVPSLYTEQSGGLTEHCEPASHFVSHVRTARRAPRPFPPPVPGTHTMALLRAASPTVTRLLATAVTDPCFESAAASALVGELLDFAAACRLDYASALVAESVPGNLPSVRGECALGTDVLEDRQEDFECLATAIPRFASLLLAPEGDPEAPDIPTPRSYAEAITGPYSSQWQAAMDAEMASWKSIGTYVNEVPPPGVNIVDGMWIFREKRPPGSSPAFKARYVARGFSQRQGVDYFQIFSPTPKMTTLWVLLHVAAQRDYELHSLDFSTQWSLRRPVYGLRQAPREWHDTLRTTLAALGFVPSTADPSLFLRTDTSLPPFYVLVYVDDLVFATADTEALTLVLQRFGFQYSSPQLTPLSTSHSLSAPPSDEFVEPNGPYPELVGCLMYLMTCTRPDLAYPLSLLARYVAPGRHQKVHWDAAKRVLRYLCSTSGMGLVLGGQGPVVLTGHVDASWVDDSATQRSSQGYTFSLGSGSVSWRSTRSSSVLSSTCEAEIYAGAMAAQELRWLTYLLTDMGE
ncbi:unnamed protein product [Closterium sp. NIES-54]